MVVSIHCVHNYQDLLEQRYPYQMKRAAVRTHPCSLERPNVGRNPSVGTPHILDVVDHTCLASLRHLRKDRLRIHLGCHRTRTEEFV